ncbi:hypothetical protein OA84_04645 [Kaistella solincola]|uniref:Glycosyltransferase 2-like domain-containing protein n=1 Tax=Kaistella solincola TaxID=510955 RepID=A0ABR4ZPH0_9FLAO|nr:glycosyltransferase [Kaistella solincola]KIA82868.1 hypothetical protein OA84_04645 [Kaistella solincola]
MVPKISIIIGNYNNGHYFIDAHRSLVEQTFTEWEAIVIDDASTDDSVSVIQQLISGESRFRFYQNPENRGYQRTVIRGIELAQADIFGRLDPDDVLYPKALELSIEEHLKYPEVGLVYTDLTVCDESLSVLYHHESVQITDLNEKYFLLAGEVGAFATFKKHFYQKAGGFDPSVKRAEDIDIYMRMCEVAPVKRLPLALYYYRFHNTSLSKMGNGDRAYFWHWTALIKMSERRDLNIEDTFIEHVASRAELDSFRNRVSSLKNWVDKNYLLSFLTNIAARFGFDYKKM